MKKNNKNAIIGGLLAIVFVMAVGYAAFATSLNISGSSSIATSWDVHIESITPGTPVGTAESSSAVIGSDKLSATFEDNLKSPGDSITYTVVVKNAGSLTAKLTGLTTTDVAKDSSGNTVTTESEANVDKAILHTVSGISEGDTIAPNSTATFTVTATYNENVTTQPNTKTAEYTIALTYEEE